MNNGKRNKIQLALVVEFIFAAHLEIKIIYKFKKGSGRFRKPGTSGLRNVAMLAPTSVKETLD